MAFELIWESRGIYRKFSGIATIVERRASLRLICADSRFDALRYSITDCLDIDAFESSRETTAEFAALHIAPMRTNPNIVIATVAVHAVAVATAEEFIALGFIKQPQRIFDSVEQARTWIAECRPSPQLRQRTGEQLKPTS